MNFLKNILNKVNKKVNETFHTTQKEQGFIQTPEIEVLDPKDKIEFPHYIPNPDITDAELLNLYSQGYDPKYILNEYLLEQYNTSGKHKLIKLMDIMWKNSNNPDIKFWLSQLLFQGYNIHHDRAIDLFFEATKEKSLDDLIDFQLSTYITDEDRKEFDMISLEAEIFDKKLFHVGWVIRACISQNRIEQARELFEPFYKQFKKFTKKDKKYTESFIKTFLEKLSAPTTNRKPITRKKSVVQDINYTSYIQNLIQGFTEQDSSK